MRGDDLLAEVAALLVVDGVVDAGFLGQVRVVVVDAPEGVAVLDAEGFGRFGADLGDAGIGQVFGHQRRDRGGLPQGEGGHRAVAFGTRRAW